MVEIKKFLTGRAFVALIWIIPFIFIGVVKSDALMYAIILFLVGTAIYEVSKLDKSSYINNIILAVNILSITFLFNSDSRPIDQVNTNFIVLSINLVFILNMLFNNFDLKSVTFYLFLTFIIGYGLNSFIAVYKMNNNLAIYFLAAIWVFDAASLVIGKKIGKTKLIKISPNKTREGLIGGFIVTIIIMSFIWFVLLQFGINLGESIQFIKAILMLPLIAISAFVGDLLFSLIKREYKVKDYGTILLSHGGVLDRIDSQLLAFITIAMLLQ